MQDAPTDWSKGPDSQMLSSRAVREWTGLSVRAIARMCNDGRFAGAVPTGGTGGWRVPRGSVRAWIKANQVTEPAT